MREALGEDAGDGSSVVADLSLGAWQGHIVASEFCAQLGLDPPQAAQASTGTRRDSFGRLSYADSIGLLIDAESSGDRTVLTALDAAARTVATLRGGAPRTFLVLAPRYDLPWEHENEMFIRFLVQGLRGSASRLILVCPSLEDVTFPASWKVSFFNEPASTPADEGAQSGLLGLVPGIISPEVLEVLQGAERKDLKTGHLPLLGGRLLVAPEARRNPSSVPHHVLEGLSGVLHPFGWLQAYAQFFGSADNAEYALLCAESQRRFTEGGYDIALRLLDSASSCAPGEIERAIAVAQAQGIRISLHRFDEVARAPEPSTTLPPQLRGILLQNKGWGLVMTNNPALADPLFKEARELLKDREGSREYLYLLNISALNKLRLGDVEISLGIENNINKVLEKRPQRDWHLEYVNSINLARLHRQRGDFKAATDFYGRAFATTLGVRSESDTVYTNICWAGLHTASGDYDRALIAWLCAGLHWVASAAPEALATRAAKAVIGQTLPPAENLPESVSEALAAKLTSTVSAAGMAKLASAAMEQADGTAAPPIFVRTEQLSRDASKNFIHTAIGARGWSVLLTGMAVSEQFTGVSHRRLRALLCRLIIAMCPQLEFEDISTVVIDNHLGHEIPGTEHELLDVCLRLSVPKLVFQDRAIQLEPRIRSIFEMKSRVRRAAPVNDVQFDASGALVTYKRYLPPQAISPEQSTLLSSANEEFSVEQLVERHRQMGTPGRIIEMLREMERLRLVVLYLPEHTLAELKANHTILWNR